MKKKAKKKKKNKKHLLTQYEISTIFIIFALLIPKKCLKLARDGW